jgi:hypothetical protein
MASTTPRAFCLSISLSNPQVFARLTVLAHDRSDHSINIIGISVLLAVLDDTPECLAFADGSPHFFEEFFRHIGMSSQTVRLSDSFFTTVLRYLAELVIAFNDIAAQVCN